MAIKVLFPWQLTLFHSPPTLQQYIHMLAGSCIWGTIGKYQNGIPKVARKAFNTDAMVTTLLHLYCGAELVQSYCKESNISNTNWLRYLSSSYLINIRLSV